MEKETTHTPGPWYIIDERIDTMGPGSYSCSIGQPNAGGITVCDVVRDAKSDEMKANARLIAAAPELLAACESVYRVSLLPGAPKDHGHAEHVPACFMCQLRAAILLRAEGFQVTTLLEHRAHVRTVQAYYRPPRKRAEFRARVIAAYERGDLRELEYLRQVRGI